MMIDRMVLEMSSNTLTRKEEAIVGKLIGHVELALLVALLHYASFCPLFLTKMVCGVGSLIEDVANDCRANVR
jgi:riboflavin transporter FmnP